MTDEIRELGFRYSGTYIKVDGSPVMVDNIGIVDDDPVITYREVGRDSWKSSHMDDVVIDYSYPKLGLINNKDYCINIYRHSARQYKRGFDPRHTSMIVPNSYEIRALRRQLPRDRSNEIIKAIYSNKYPDIEFAFNRIITRKRLSYAFDKDFYFIIKSGSSSVLLGYKRWMIARMDDNMEAHLPEPFHHMYESVNNILQCRRV